MMSALIVGYVGPRPTAKIRFEGGHPPTPLTTGGAGQVRTPDDVGGERERPVVSLGRLASPAEAGEQLYAGDLVRLIIMELEAVHLGERNRGSVDLGEGDRPIDGDNRL